MTSNFNDIIDDLKRKTKAGELPREVRIAEIDRVTEEWFARTGDMPDAKQLERLADLILYEELTDGSNEILSDTQMARRQEGKHARKTDNPKIEVPFKIAENVGVDKRNYNKPIRRERSHRENEHVDKSAKIRNDERKKSYKEFTRVQPIIKSKLEG
jgi:transcriptional regulator with XRE-family HTH domain